MDECIGNLQPPGHAQPFIRLPHAGFVHAVLARCVHRVVRCAGVGQAGGHAVIHNVAQDNVSFGFTARITHRGHSHRPNFALERDAANNAAPLSLAR